MPARSNRLTPQPNIASVTPAITCYHSRGRCGSRLMVGNSRSSSAEQVRLRNSCPYRACPSTWAVPAACRSGRCRGAVRYCSACQRVRSRLRSPSRTDRRRQVQGRRRRHGGGEPVRASRPAEQRTPSRRRGRIRRRPCSGRACRHGFRRRRRRCGRPRCRHAAARPWASGAAG
jgi:hypothetical protein